MIIIIIVVNNWLGGFLIFCAQGVCTPAVFTPLRVLYYLFTTKEDREKERGVAAHVVELDTHSKGE